MGYNMSDLRVGTPIISGPIINRRSTMVSTSKLTIVHRTIKPILRYDGSESVRVVPRHDSDGFGQNGMRRSNEDRSNGGPPKSCGSDGPVLGLGKDTLAGHGSWSGPGIPSR